MVQWLSLCASTAEGASSIPGRGTKIPHTAMCGPKKQKQEQKTDNSSYLWWGKTAGMGVRGVEKLHYIPLYVSLLNKMKIFILQNNRLKNAMIKSKPRILLTLRLSKTINMASERQEKFILKRQYVHTVEKKNST